MNKVEFIQFLDKSIQDEMLLGANGNRHKLLGLRNIKSDFNYLCSNNPDMNSVEILKKLYKERKSTEDVYIDLGKLEFAIQETTEMELISKWLPKEPSNEEVMSYLQTLTNIPKQKSSFKKFQEACTANFGQKVDSQIILNFIEN